MKTERFEMRATADFLKLVDDWRRRQPDIPPRAEAIRRIVEEAVGSEAGRATLSELLTQFFAADPERITLYGCEEQDSPAEAARRTLDDDPHQSPAGGARRLLDAFEDATDPVGREIAALLKRVAS